MSIEVRVGGRWLKSIAGWGELIYSHAADGGCKEASWRMDLPPRFSHPALVRNALVEIKAGAWNLWQGFLTEPDIDDDWTFHAAGLYQRGRDRLCLDGSGNLSSVPNTVIDRAIAAGIGWTRPTSISAIAFTPAATDEPIQYIGDLLDQYAQSVGKRWGVNAAGQVYMVSDPTVPAWHLVPGAGRFGLADDEYASDIYVRYVSSGGYATAHVFDPISSKLGVKEYPVDATKQGVLTAPQAALVGNALVAKGKARLGFTNGLEVSRYQLTNPGGEPASLTQVVGGQLVRQFGVIDEQGQPLPHVDWVIGETQLEAGSESIALTPVGLVARTLSDVLAVA